MNIPIKDFYTQFIEQERIAYMQKVDSQYSKGICINCSNDIVAHYGGFYRNSKGQVFCSHECIEEFKND